MKSFSVCAPAVSFKVAEEETMDEEQEYDVYIAEVEYPAESFSGGDPCWIETTVHYSDGSSINLSPIDLEEEDELPEV